MNDTPSQILGPPTPQTVTSCTVAMTMTLVAVAVSLCLAMAGCSDDAESQPPAPDGAVPDQGVIADGTLSDGLAADGAPPAGTWAVLVRGALASTDLAKMKTTHDAVAKGGETAAKAAGDQSHDVLLGTKLLGTTENEFMGLDTWNNLSGLQKFYADPNFIKAFSTLFKSAPAPEIFVKQDKWHGWGDLKSGDAHKPYYFVVARGTLKEKDASKAKAAHDAVAAGGESIVKAAGDVAHIVFTGLKDPQEFMAIDIWKDSANIAKTYTDPNFAKGFAALFSGTPTIAVYKSTDWHQW